MEPILDEQDSPRIAPDYTAQADAMFSQLEARINSGWIEPELRKKKTGKKPKETKEEKEKKKSR